MFLQSELLRRAGAVHGFSLRAGGVSEGPFASLNLGGAVGDAPAAVEENHRRLAAVAGFPREALRTALQVHGDAVVEAEEAAGAEADALVVRRPGLAVGVRTADCVPILLLDREGGAAAAVHAGWRGTELRIAARAVAALGGRGTVAAIGPSIRRCCYEVSEELAGRFRAAFGPAVAEGRMLDLVEANRAILQRAGVREIEVVGGCTACRPDLHFSHRRDRGRTGRHLAFVLAAPAAAGRRSLS